MKKRYDKPKPFKDIHNFSQGIDGIRKQYRELMTRDVDKEVKSGKKMACLYDLKYLCTEQFGYEDWDTIHDDIQKSLDTLVIDKDKRKELGRQFRLYLIPRGHLKSSVVTKGWSTQQFLRDPNIRILIVNAIWDNARGFARTIMQFVAEGFTELPDIFGEFEASGRGKKWSPDAFTIAHRSVALDAATVTTSGVERAQASQHYDIILLDDVVVRENINTKEQRAKVSNFYKDCMSLLEPDGICIVIGTTWHDDDLYSSHDEERLGLIYDEDFQPVFKRIAETGTEESVLFKKKFTYENLMKIKKKQGNFLYSSQYLLNPYPDEDMTFRKNWIHYWKFDEEHNTGHILPRDLPLYVAMTIDPSMGKKRSDHAAIVCVGIDATATKYVLDAHRFKRKMEFIPDEVVKTLKKLSHWGYNIDVIGIEYFGFQQSLLKPIKEAVEKARFKTHVELLATVNNRISSKENRIEGLIPDFNAYRVYIHETQKDLEDELLRFNPNVKNKSDDIIDALAWNRQYWSRKPQIVEKKEILEGSFVWYMKNRRFNRDTTDMFQEYR